MKIAIAAIGAALLLAVGNISAQASSDTPTAYPAPSPTVAGGFCAQTPEDVLSSPVLDEEQNVVALYSAPVDAGGSYEVTVSVVPEAMGYADIFDPAADTAERVKTLTYSVSKCDPLVLYVLVAPVFTNGECGNDGVVTVPVSTDPSVYDYVSERSGNSVSITAYLLPDALSFAGLVYEGNERGTETSSLTWVYDVTPATCSVADSTCESMGWVTDSVGACINPEMLPDAPTCEDQGLVTTGDECVERADSAPVELTKVVQQVTVWPIGGADTGAKINR